MARTGTGSSGRSSARASRPGWNVRPRSATAIPPDRSILRSNTHRSPATPSAMRSSTCPRTTRTISDRLCCCARCSALGRRHRAATLGDERDALSGALNAGYVSVLVGCGFSVCLRGRDHARHQEPGRWRLHPRVQVIDRVIQNNQPLFMFVWVGSVLSLIAAAVSGLWVLSEADRLLFDRCSRRLPSVRTGTNCYH